MGKKLQNFSLQGFFNCVFNEMFVKVSWFHETSSALKNFWLRAWNQLTINKLPTINSYRECGQYVGNEGIRNVMSRTRFEQILQNLHFADDQKDKKLNKA